MKIIKEISDMELFLFGKRLKWYQGFIGHREDACVHRYTIRPLNVIIKSVEWFQKWWMWKRAWIMRGNKKYQYYRPNKTQIDLMTAKERIVLHKGMRPGRMKMYRYENKEED